MSKQIEAEGSQYWEQNPPGEPLITFKIKFTHADLLHTLYLCVAIPCITLLVAIAFWLAFVFKLNEILYYIFVGTIIMLYTSVLYIDWARNYKPLLLPSRKNMRIQVFQSGFVCVAKGKKEVVLWEQIKRVRYYSTEANGGVTLSPKLKVWRNDGKKFVFDANLTNIEALGKLVEREFHKCQPQTTNTTVNQ